MNTMSTLVHHGINFVPLGYKHAGAELMNIEEIHGGMCRLISMSCRVPMHSQVRLGVLELYVPLLAPGTPVLLS